MKLDLLIRWAFVLILFSSYTLSAQFKISGTVTDEKGEPLTGATIQLLRTSKGALSGADGTFEINNITSGQYFIEVSYIGYQPKQRSLQIEDNLSLEFKMTVAAEELSEVIVSANRRLQDIQKTASSVSAIGSSRIQELQVKNFNELNSIAPNFRSYDDGAGGAFTLFASRGISTIDINPAIGLYVDNVPYFTTYAYPLALSDVDQIEILRGPQGTLYGRNALAGVIKITTKEPSNKVSGFATAGLGNLGYQEYGVGFNAPLLKDKLFFRANINYTERDGFVENQFNGEDLQNRLTTDGNLRLKYFASDRFSVAFNYGYQYRESMGYAFALANPELSFQDILENNPYEVNFNEDVFQEATTHNMALNLTYDFDKYNLTSVTAYQLTDQNRLDEFDYSPLSIQWVDGGNDLTNISQEFRLSSNEPGPLQWTTGVFLYRINNETDETLFSGVDNAQDPFAPNQRDDDVERIVEGVAVFGQASFELTNQLTLTGGLRFDYEEASASFIQASSIEGIPVNSFEESADFSAVSPKISLSYQANPDMFLFANVARGFRPGGINTFVTNAEDAPYDPENTLNYELGFKSNLLENRLKFNLTGFYIQYSDQQVFTVLDAATFNFGTDNIGESRSFGLEIESQWVAAKGLTINANIGYLNTEIVDFISSGIDFFTFEEIQNDESGNDLPVSPEFNGNLNIVYKVPISDKLSFEASVDYIYQSEMFWDIPNQVSQDAYGLLNARVGATSRNLDLFFWGKNLTDEVYFSYGYGVGGFNAASFGLPTTYGVTVTGKF